MGRHLVRLAVAGSFLVCCTDLSGLQGQTNEAPDGSTSDSSLEGAANDATTTEADSPEASTAVSCTDASADVLYCATFDQGTTLAMWGLVDIQIGGQLTLDPTQGVSAPGALNATIPVHDAAAGYMRARMRKILPTNLDRFRVSLSVRPVTLDNDENFVTVDFGVYTFTLKGTQNGNSIVMAVREDVPQDGGGFTFPLHDLAYAQTPGTWQRYQLDVYRTENSGTASHVDVRVAGKSVTVPLSAHTITPTKLTLSYGFDGSDLTTIDEAAFFDDVVVEAL